MYPSTSHVLCGAISLCGVVFFSGCPGANPLSTPPRVTTSMVRVGDSASLAVQFSADGVDPDGGSVRYLWDFKDGSVVSERIATHTFSSSGYRQIELTVTDDEGAATHVSLNLTVPLSGANSIQERLVPNEGATHVAVGTTVQYATNPPASGPHYSAAGISPAAKGFHDETLRPEIWVHNLEHGDVVVLYDCAGTCATDFLDQLRALPNAVPPSSFGTKKIVITRYPGLATPIIAVAWDVQLDFQSFDQDGLISFYERHEGKGPEDEP